MKCVRTILNMRVLVENLTGTVSELFFTFRVYTPRGGRPEIRVKTPNRGVHAPSESMPLADFEREGKRCWGDQWETMKAEIYETLRKELDRANKYQDERLAA